MRQVKRMLLPIFALALMLQWTVPAMAMDHSKVNINTAGVEKLMTLARIGQSYAKRIVAYRQRNGSFKKPEDILMVKGIGPKILEANTGRIVVKDK